MESQIAKGFLFAVLAAASSMSAAGTEAEYQALRSWCIQRAQHEHDAAWKAANDKPNYFHFHHYCDGLKGMTLAYTAQNATQRAGAIKDVIAGTSYVLSNIPETHTLKAEAYALRGQGYLFAKRYAEAESDLSSALRLDPRHQRAFGHLATLYMDVGRRDEAAKVVRAGLSVVPGNKLLRQKGRELGIDLPPEQAPPEVAGGAATIQPGPPQDAAEKPVSDTSPQAAETNQGETAAISGCRFCPPEEIQQKWRESFGEPPKK